MRYRDAGVDIHRADALKQALGEAARATWGAGVRKIPGGFVLYRNIWKIGMMNNISPISQTLKTCR